MEIQSLQQRILSADDQQDILDALRLLLKGHGYATQGVTSPFDLMEALANNEFDLLLMDLNYARDTTSGQEGLDLLALLQKNGNLPPVVVMTGWATVGLAVEAMQRGVADFVEKPWTNTRLLEILQKQIALGRERRESRRRAEQESQARREMIPRNPAGAPAKGDSAASRLRDCQRVAVGPYGGRRLLRYPSVWRRSAGALHWRRGGKRTSRRPSDVQSAGRCPRIGFLVLAARWLVLAAERSSVPEHDQRPLHHFFLRAA
jgi:FixJ family two-component response regulator